MFQPTKLNVHKNDMESWDYTAPPTAGEYSNLIQYQPSRRAAAASFALTRVRYFSARQAKWNFKLERPEILVESWYSFETFRLALPVLRIGVLVSMTLGIIYFIEFQCLFWY